MEAVTGFTAASSRTPSSSRYPRFGLVEVIHLVDAELTRHRPGEHTHRVGDPVDAGDEGEPLPGRAVRELDTEPGLHVLDPGPGLEAVEVRQHEENPRLSRVDRLLQSRLQDLAIVVAGELARGAQADDAGGRVVHPRDHRVVQTFMGLTLLRSIGSAC